MKAVLKRINEIFKKLIKFWKRFNEIKKENLRN